MELIVDEKEEKNSWSWLARVGNPDYRIRNASTLVALTDSGLLALGFGGSRLIRRRYIESVARSVLKEYHLNRWPLL